VRGAGSVVAGANAIAGTVNLITRRPSEDFFSLSSTLGVMENGALDPVATANVGVVNDEATAGVLLFGQVRQRQAYDRNGDALSELPQLGTQSLGMSAFWQPGKNTSLDLNAGLLSENRRGGSMDFQRAEHQSEAAESIAGNSIYYDLRFTQQLSAWQLTLFGGGMHTRRDNYYGAGFDADAYGHTEEDNLNAGASFSRRAFDDRLLVLFGADARYHDVIDAYPGYDRLLEQAAWLAGGFLQANYALTDWLTIDVGMRADYHNLLERVVANPRVGLSGQAGQWGYRVNYAQGYRPPVAANEALHMAMVGGELRQVVLGDALDAERSQSFTGGVTRSISWKGGQLLAKLDGFYTTLENTFVYEPLAGIDDGLTFEMRNGGDSRVTGATLELELQQAWLNLRSGWTYQQTRLDEPAAWSDMLEGQDASTDEYLRTPDWYGYLVATAQPTTALQLTAEANFTGRMFAPHYGVPLEDAQAYLAEVPQSDYALETITNGTIRTDALNSTPIFAELGLHAAYTFELKGQLQLTLKAGGRNLLDSFQDDYDAGPLRDAGYIYGPHLPRMLYGGFSLSY
ncbi:MAG: TonB-dependent receptor plug domain-containing protein, partial [Bacteroidota bacterium]